MQNTYNEIGDTSVIFLHVREYLSYSLAMEKCWSNARILHCATMEKSVIFKPFNYVVWFIIAIASFSTELGVVVHETCCQQASTAACLNALCVTSSLAASLWCLPCVTTIPSHACFENSACDPPSSLLIVICHHSWFLFCILWLVLCYSCCSLLSHCAILAAHHHDTCHSMHLVLLEYNKSARFSEIYTRLDNNHDNGLKNGQINEIHRLTKH